MSDGTLNKLDWKIEAHLRMVRMHFYIFSELYHLLHLNSIRVFPVCTEIHCCVELGVDRNAIYRWQESGEIPE